MGVDDISVLSAAITMEMLAVEIAAGRFLLMKGAQTGVFIS